MRYGVISDIHGNLPALRTSIETLRGQGVDRFVCLGDIVGYGPQPNECVDVVASLGAICVAGNHELIAVGRIPESDAGELALKTLRWTRDVLNRDAWNFISGLPLQVELPGDIIVTHASLHDPQMYVRRPSQADEQLGLLEREHPDARILLIGHTHRQWVYRRNGGTTASSQAGQADLAAGGHYLLNPGSVGQAYARNLGAVRARFMHLDSEAGRVTQHSVAYDAKCCADEMLRAGLPRSALFRRPPVLPMEFHRARAILARRVMEMIRRAGRAA